MGFGKDFIGYVKTMHCEVTAAIEVNDELTSEIQTGGGVRQGCPLSPFLFICVLELMAVAIRENKEIKGIIEPETGIEDKISLFADDSCVCLRDPIKNVNEARI